MLPLQWVSVSVSLAVLLSACGRIGTNEPPVIEMPGGEPQHKSAPSAASVQDPTIATRVPLRLVIAHPPAADAVFPSPEACMKRRHDQRNRARRRIRSGRSGPHWCCSTLPNRATHRRLFDCDVSLGHARRYRAATRESFGYHLALSPDGLELAVEDSTRRIYFYRRASVSAQFAMTPTQTLGRPISSGYAFGAIAYTSDGLELAVGDTYFDTVGGVVHFYRRANVSAPLGPNPSETLMGPSGSNAFGVSVAYTSDGLELAVGDTHFGSGNVGGVYFYRRTGVDAQFGMIPNQTLPAPSGSSAFGSSMAYTSDGLELAVGDPNFGAARAAGYISTGAQVLMRSLA